MKTHHLMLCVLLISIQQVKGQCKTYGLDSANFVNQPWYGNNQYLTDFLTARGYVGNGANFRTECPGPRYQLPVRIVVFRDGDNNAGSNVNQILAESYLQEANQAFDAAGTGIHFYLQEFEFIADDQAHSEVDGLFDLFGDDDKLTSMELFIQNRIDGMINIYFVRNTGSNETSSGTAATPASNQIPGQYPGALWSCWVRTHDNPNGGKRNDVDITNTLVHELGHVLGNAHTHHPGRLGIFNSDFDADNAEKSSCWQEVVSRTEDASCPGNNGGLKCELNGDGLCDTPGDPNMSTERVNNVVVKGVASNTCEYSVGNFDSRYEFDRNGVTWNPNERNIMAYSANICQDEFSNMQIAIMWNRIENRFMEYFKGDFSGSSVVCSSGGTVNFNNPPQGMNISWTASPSSLFHPSTRSGSGTSAYIKPASSSTRGWGTISFHESDDCEFFSTSYQIWLGQPTAPPGFINGEDNPYYGQIETYTISSGGAYGTYDWSIPGGKCLLNSGDCWEIVSGGDGYGFVQVIVGTSDGYIQVRKNNQCGFGAAKVMYVSVNSGGGPGGGGPCPTCPQPIVGPNPSSEEVRITFTDAETEKRIATREFDYPIEYTLMKMSGHPVKSKESRKTDEHIDLSEVKNGLYLLQISHKGKGIQTVKIRVNK